MQEGDATCQVTLTQSFELGQYEVTQEQYEKMMGTNPSTFKGQQNPVEMVSWNDCVEFCRKLSELPEEQAAGYEYRLPTEAEWEYACRSGTATAYSFGEDEGQLGEFAWYRGNSNRSTHPVGLKQPNSWGLYDMYGNVWERCHDWYHPLSGGSATDPSGRSSGTARIMRGGGIDSPAEFCRSAFRSAVSPDNCLSEQGFRVLRVRAAQTRNGIGLHFMPLKSVIADERTTVHSIQPWPETQITDELRKTAQDT